MKLQVGPTTGSRHFRVVSGLSWSILGVAIFKRGMKNQYLYRSWTSIKSNRIEFYS